MIRRVVGDEYWLITQADHAQLAAELAGHFGNGEFQGVRDSKSVMLGVGMHDSGWPLHDDSPTLNGRGEPLDVFEVPREIGLTVWSASADRAEAADAYAGLLTSLHVLSLSVYATSQTPGKHEKFDMTLGREKFEINKFQQREIERQETLRRALGMRTDLPLKYGLALTGVDKREDQLLFDFRMLQAMDLTSLAMCCATPPTMQTREVWTRPGGKTATVVFSKRGELVVSLAPWPFDRGKLEFTVPFRRMKKRRFESVEVFREAYLGTKVEPVRVLVEQ